MGAAATAARLSRLPGMHALRELPELRRAEGPGRLRLLRNGGAMMDAKKAEEVGVMLERLMSLCACEVTIEINAHRNYYQPVDVWLRKRGDMSPTKPAFEISDDVRCEMVRRNRLVEIRFYPQTPVGFYSVMHYDLVEALKNALACLEDEARP
ncbi:MAG: hypothetical protein WC876_01770 [Candidatus Thermoplasmatota archaeon]